MKKPAIMVRTNEPTIKPTLDAIKENLEIIQGQRGGKITPLGTDATLAGVITKVNELLERLQ